MAFAYFRLVTLDPIGFQHQVVALLRQRKTMSRLLLVHEGTSSVNVRFEIVVNKLMREKLCSMHHLDNRVPSVDHDEL